MTLTKQTEITRKGAPRRQKMVNALVLLGSEADAAAGHSRAKTLTSTSATFS